MQDIKHSQIMMVQFFHRRSRLGVSLTEVLMAMALITLCVGGIVALSAQSVGAGQSNDYAYVATNLAKNRMERIRQIRKDKGYAVLPEAAESDVLIDRNGVSDQNGEFKRTTIIDSAYAANLTKVTVRVNYKTRGVFLSQSVELVTLISIYS